MAKQGNIKHYRQTGAAKKPTALPFGEIAVAKDGTIYAGSESNVPVSKADTALACTGNAATVGDNSTLAYGGAIATTQWLAAWEGKTVRCIAPTDVTVGNASHLMGLDVGVSDEGTYIILRKNGKDYKYTDAVRAVVAEVCTGHAALDAYAPQEATNKPQTGGESVIGVRFFYYPSECNQYNCFVAAVLVNGKQIQCESTLSAGDISVQCGEVDPKVIVQRYK